MKKIILVAALAAGLAAGAETRVGIIGCDTSHAIAFTKLMNVDKDPDCAGFRVTAAHKWGSPDIFSSTNRYPKYIAQLEEMGVVMKPSIADLLKDVDAVLGLETLGMVPQRHLWRPSRPRPILPHLCRTAGARLPSRHLLPLGTARLQHQHPRRLLGRHLPPRQTPSARCLCLSRHMPPCRRNTQNLHQG